MVLFLWVIKINSVVSLFSCKYLPKVSTLASSRAASTSSNIQNGLGLTFKMANNTAIAVRVFSPPDNRPIELSFFPGGSATISIPVFKISLGSVKSKLPFPPLNNFLNT